MDTLEGISALFDGLGDVASAVKKYKSYKNAYKELLSMGYDKDTARQYAKQLKPHQVLDLKFKYMKEQQRLDENRAARRAAGQPEYLADTPSKALKKNIEYEPGISESPTASIRSYFTGEKRSLDKPELLRDEEGRVVGAKIVQPNGTVVTQSVEELGPEAVAGLEREEQQAAGQPSLGIQVAQGIIPGAIGFGAQAVGKTGDLASLLTYGAERLTGTGMPAGTHAQNIEHINKQIAELPAGHPRIAELERLKAFNPETFNPAAQLRSVLPTTENIKKAVQKGAAYLGVPESYIKPQTEAARKVEEIGEAAGLLASPVALAKQGAGALGAGLAKALGIAAGGDVAGWLTEQKTGSKAAGELVKNGVYLGYLMFPGTLNKQAADKYKQFEDAVINKAEQDGARINLKSEADAFNAIQRDINKLRHSSESAQWLHNETAKLEELFKPGAQVTPKALQKSYRDLIKKTAKAPSQAKEYALELVDLQRNALKKFADTYAPGSAQLLTEADTLYKTGKKVTQDLTSLKNILNPRNYGVALPLLWMGGYKGLATLGAGAMGINYMQKMLSVPSVRTTLGHLFKAAGQQNAVLVKKLAERLNNQVDKELKKLPDTQEQRMRAALQQAAERAANRNQ